MTRINISISCKEYTIYEKCEMFPMSMIYATHKDKLFFSLKGNRIWPSLYRPGEIMSWVIAKPDVFHIHLRELVKGLDVSVVCYVCGKTIYF